MSIARAEDRLAELIADHAGRRLPAERQLASALGIGRQQLRGLLRACAERGLVDRRHGSGTYVVDRRRRRVRRLTLVVDPALRLGEDPFFMAVIEALQQAAQDDGQVVTLSRVPGDAPAGDGLIALGRAAAPMWRAWSSPRIAWLVDGAQAGMRASVIELDDEPGGRAAAVRLVDAGCRSIVFTGSTRLPSPRARWRGAAAVAAAAGLTFTTIESAMNLAAGLTLVDRLPRGRLGVIAANDCSPPVCAAECSPQVALRCR